MPLSKNSPRRANSADATKRAEPRLSRASKEPEGSANQPFFAVFFAGVLRAAGFFAVRGAAVLGVFTVRFVSSFFSGFFAAFFFATMLVTSGDASCTRGRHVSTAYPSVGRQPRRWMLASGAMGNIANATETYECQACGNRWGVPAGARQERCPKCGSMQVRFIPIHTGGRGCGTLLGIFGAIAAVVTVVVIIVFAKMASCASSALQEPTADAGPAPSVSASASVAHVPAARPSAPAAPSQAPTPTHRGEKKDVKDQATSRDAGR